MVANDGGCCRVIMRDGVLVPGMTMPVVGPPPPDPHPNVAVQRLREAWNMNIIAWDGVFSYDGPWRRRARSPLDAIPALLAAEVDDDEQPVRFSTACPGSWTCSSMVARRSRPRRRSRSAS